jgi:hypothetical protein
MQIKSSTVISRSNQAFVYVIILLTIILANTKASMVSLLFMKILRILKEVLKAPAKRGKK